MTYLWLLGIFAACFGLCITQGTNSEISCQKPQISKGVVTNPKNIYKEDDRISYSCNPGFKSERNAEATCTGNGWSPEPSCVEIVCYPDRVINGQVTQPKVMYKEGETIKVQCDRGFQLEGDANLPRTCTKNGWSPPMKCISKMCDDPNILHGAITWRTNYGFPRRILSYIEYYCDKGYLPPEKEYYVRSTCTENGWSPRPRCLRTCSNYNVRVDNAELLATQNVYVSGERVRFRCYRDYKTEDGNEEGERECLPTGAFTAARCRYRKNCTITALDHGRYQPKKSSFSVGEYLRYQCDEGFVSPRRSRGEHVQCLTDGWQHTPQCTDITCTIPEGGKLISTKQEYKEGERVQLSCPVGYSLSGSANSQCHYYGWDPSLSTCEGNPCGKPPVVEFANILGEKSNYKHNDLVEYKCLSGYKRERPSTAICLKGEWHDLPVCVSTKCDPPKPIPNGKIKNEVKTEYLSGEKVQYECNSGFALQKKRDEAVCENTQWVQTPVCRQIGERCGPPPLIEYGEIRQNRNKTYESGSTVEYLCPNYYIMEGNAIIECENGVWDDPPVCLEPCITGEKAMKEHNIRLKGSSDTKIYSEHGDFVSFSCLDGYEINYEQALTVLCIRGVMRYPTCSKRGAFERENPVTFEDSHIIIFKRYIDDLFLIWRGTQQDLNDWFDNLNQLSVNLKFKITYHCEVIDFLDLRVKKSTGTLCTELFTKPTDRNSMLLYTSCHPTGIKKALPISQFQRVVRNNSTREGKEEQLTNMYQKFKERSYVDEVLQEAYAQAVSMTQDQALTSSERNKDQPTMDRLTFVTEYSPDKRDFRGFPPKFKQSSWNSGEVMMTTTTATSLDIENEEDYAHTFQFSAEDATRIRFDSRVIKTQREIPLHLYNQILKLKKRRIDFKLHGCYLSAYHEKMHIPKGFRIKNMPTIGRNNPVFCKKWCGILNKCSLDLMLLVIEETGATLKSLEIEITQFETDHLCKLEQDQQEDWLTKLHKQLKDYEGELIAFKEKKWEAVTTDYREKRVYQWTLSPEERQFRMSRRRPRVYKPRNLTTIDSSDNATDNEAPSTSTECYELNQEEKDVLNKGLSFIPTTYANEFDMLVDSYKFQRTLRLKEFFKDTPKETDVASFELKKKSTFDPRSLQPSILTYSRLTSDEMRETVRKNKSNIRNNLSKRETQALKKLQENASIVIREADKGGALVIQDYVCYKREIMSQLEDSKVYEKLPNNPTQKFKSKIDEYLNQLKKENQISPSLLSYLQVEHPIVPVLYTLPKVHKHPSKPPGRPIVSARGSILQPIATYLDRMLQPFVQMIPSYLKDSIELIKILQKLSDIRDTDILVTLDVTSLYTVIPHNEGAFERENPVTFEDSHIIIFKRYIDDLFLIWRGTQQDLNDWFDNLNQLSVNLKFKITYHCEVIDFLDLRVKKSTGTLCTELFTKPTDRNSMLLYTSCHPTGIKKALPISQFQRVVRNNSTREGKEEQLTNMYQKFKERSYVDEVLQEAYAQAVSMTQDQALTSSERNKDQPTMDRLTFVTEYSPDKRDFRGTVHHTLCSHPKMTCLWLLGSFAACFGLCITQGTNLVPTCSLPRDNFIQYWPFKRVYKLNDVVESVCPEGYKLKGSKLSQCFSYGWGPALPTCEEETESPSEGGGDEQPHPAGECNSPKIIHGNLQWSSSYGFPKQIGSIIDYSCDDGYLPPDKMLNGRSICTESGWDPRPQCLTTKCDPPKTIENGRIINKLKALYESGEKVQYQCTWGFALEKNRNEAVCEDTQWVQTPVCRRIGKRCGPPPVIQYGDTRQDRKTIYESGNTVEYLCPNYYVMEGKAVNKCENGVWDDPPECLEPCTARDKEMKAHNVRLRWRIDTKLYAQHGDAMSLACLEGYEIHDAVLLRAQCNRGVLKYPKCIKRGSCVLSQTTMEQNSIYLNRTSEIENGETVEFKCNEGMVPETSLTATCRSNIINYPKCIADRIGEGCGPPPVVQYGDTRQDRKTLYHSGSTVEYLCPNYYVMEGNSIIKCENGVWENPPVCLEPCTADEKEMKAHNVRLRWRSDTKLYSAHGDTVSFTCLDGYEIHDAVLLRAQCNRGVLKYPKCIKRE
ncbi:uncharacterized protein LOC128641198 [Bombina bombina]|uniref:uncharacterized protein LOC128641198 n=1 Tax=Bombina bombina TaxID=8345 RepID=UPI00235AA61D|nr:uncharacterized protein LOC128641198 [Bombina bombina]